MHLQLGLVFVFISAAAAMNCTGQSDGIYEPACKTYVTCVNGVATTHECLGGQVYNSDIQACDNINNVGPPCGFPSRDCSDILDNRYPELQDCSWYYTCYGGIDIGHNSCPQGLVFSYELQICVWPWDECPPCGTKASGCPSLFVG